MEAMSHKLTKEQMLTILRRAGAPDPEALVKSEQRENIAQLARHLFLRAAWKEVVSEDDSSWIDALLQPPQRANEPGAAIVPALQRLLACGAERADINEVVRVMQWELLFGLCYLLSDPTVATRDLHAPELDDFSWGLFELDKEGRPGRPIGMLHESVLETDPTGRQMRPRPRRS